MSDKTLPPTRRKLREARRRGDIPISRDLNAVAALAGLLAVLWLGGGYLAERLRALVALAVQAGAGGAAAPLATLWWPVVRLGLEVVLPVLLGGAVVSVLCGLVQTRGNLSATPVTPDFSRLSPGRMLQQLFSGRQLAELGKVLLKVGLLGGTLVLAVAVALDPLLHLGALDAAGAADWAWRWLLRLAGAGAVVYAALAALDLLHQHLAYVKRHRMSVQELRREQREDEGDPRTRARRRRWLRELADGGAAAPGLAQATVLIANPTHVAVALHYERGRTPLPRVVAKGTDAAALRLRADAERLGIPVVEDRWLARRLHAAVPLDGPIDEDLFEPVAEVLRRVRDGGAVPPRPVELAPLARPGLGPLHR